MTRMQLLVRLALKSVRRAVNHYVTDLGEKNMVFVPFITVGPTTNSNLLIVKICIPIKTKNESLLHLVQHTRS
jgi:hypothetical protein